MSHNRTSTRSLIAEEKRQRAIDLRRRGYTYQEIATEIGTTSSNAYKLVSTALNRIRDETNEISDHVKTLELVRLDSLFKYAYRAVVDGDISAIDKAVKVMDRRARLLGLDVTSKNDPADDHFTRQEWIDLRGILLKTLARYPEARQAVLAAITIKEGGGA